MGDENAALNGSARRAESLSKAPLSCGIAIQVMIFCMLNFILFLLRMIIKSCNEFQSETVLKAQEVKISGAEFYIRHKQNLFHNWKAKLTEGDWICCSSFVHLKIFEDPLTLKWSCCCRILYNVNCCRKLLKHVFLGFLAISIIAEIVKKRLERAPQQNE